MYNKLVFPDLGIYTLDHCDIFSEVEYPLWLYERLYIYSALMSFFTPDSLITILFTTTRPSSIGTCNRNYKRKV